MKNFLCSLLVLVFMFTENLIAEVLKNEGFIKNYEVLEINNINEIKRFWKKNKIAKPKTNKIVMQKRINNWKKTIKNLISLNN